MTQPLVPVDAKSADWPRKIGQAINWLIKNTSAGGAGVWGSITGTLSDQTDLQTALDGKEPSITSGTSGQYWRGDKTFQTLNNIAVGLGNVTNIAQTSVTGLTGTQTVAAFKTGLSLVKGDVGLGSVDNTADAAKAVLSATKLTTARTIGMTGDVTWSSGSFDGTGNVTAAGTLATVNANVGTFGSATQVAQFTVNGKGLITGVSAVTITAAWGSLTGIPAAVSSLTGTNTGDQTITLTGDVTGTGTGSFAATIGAGKVTLAKIANASANSKLLGSGASGSGASYAELSLGTGLSITGTTLNSSGVGGSSYEGGPPTPPLAASFSWVNQSTTTATDRTRCLEVKAVNLGSNVLSLLMQSSPTAPYDFYLRFDSVSIFGTTPQFGLALRNSSTGKFLSYVIFGATSFIGQRWNSATSFSANWLSGGAFAGPIYPHWMRVNVTSTTVSAYLSSNGLDWVLMGTETISTFVSTVDQVGLIIGVNAGTHVPQVSYFSTTAPA